MCGPEMGFSTASLGVRIPVFKLASIPFALPVLFACSETYTTCPTEGEPYTELVDLFKEQKKDEIVEAIRPLAEDGDGGAQHLIGLLLWESNPAEAFRWVSLSAEQGCIEGAVGVATAYREGVGVEKNSSEAFKWFLKAAESGDRGAASMVSFMYDKGEGVEQNNEQFQYWFEKANEKQ